LLPSTTREITYAALFTGLIAMGAFVALPVGPVPFTLQVLFVLLAGMVLGPRFGVLSVLAYLLLGLVAPVYAAGASGFAALFGPTGGYLWGFVLAALVTGLVSQAGAPILPRLVGAGLLGLVPIYVLGTLWLALQRRGAVLLAGRAEGSGRRVGGAEPGQPAAGPSCASERPLTSASARPRRRRLMRPRSYSPRKSVELPSR
jgi:biotin transport system substrate-specific component